MADLDSLNIRISASTDQASKSIDRLIVTLGKLSGAFNISGMDTFAKSLDAISVSLNNINSKPLKSLADAATRLSKVSSGSFNGILEGLRALQSIQLSDTLANINYIRDSMGKIGGKSGMAAGESLKQLAAGIQAMNIPVPQIGEELSQFAVGVRALGSKKVVNASTALSGVAKGLNELKAIGSVPQIEGLSELASSLAKFGYKSAQDAVVTIPKLADAFKYLIQTLDKAPAIKQSVIDLANAMAKLTSQTKSVAPAARTTGRNLSLFAKHARRAHKASFSLASAIGKLYATYWAFLRLGQVAGGSLKMASDLIETQNVVDHVFGNMKYAMEDFSKTAVETVGMSELTAKTIASQFQAMGMNMDISSAMMKRTSDFVEEVTGGYAKASDSMADMSLNLTKLAGDMASFYNLPYEDVAEDLQSIFTGQTKPMRRFGVDLTVASLKAWALANGLNADIKNMTLAEKAMLRYQYVMAHTTAAQGDFLRTQETWANQTKIASENVKRLGVILGQIGLYSFKPLVKSFNVAMNDIIHLAESTFNALGTIFGWQIEITDVGILDDVEDGLEDIEDGFDGAGKEAKKFKNFLLGIDELNLLPDNSDKNKGSGAGSMIGATANGLQDSLVDMKKTEKGFDSIYDTLYKLGARIGEVQKEWLKGIDWDSVFGKAESFGKGLASFLNGYLSDAETFYNKGRFIANGINTVAHAIYGFFHEFDGYQLGKDLGFGLNGITRNLDWGTIKSATYEMAHDLTEAINGIIENVNWQDVGRTIAEMLNTVQLFISTFWNEIKWDKLGVSAGEVINSFFLNWDEEEAARMIKGKLQAVLDFANNLLSSADFEMIGEKIGKFLSELNLHEYADEIADLLWNLLKASFNLLTKMFEEAPIETALILGVAGFKFNAFGNTLGGSLASSVTASFSPKLVSLLKTDITQATTHSGILGAAELLGTAIGTALVTAITAYVGYNLGLELGKKLHPEDAMWYTQDAIEQAFADFEYWIPAAAEAIGSNRSDFGYFQDDKIATVVPYFSKLLKADQTDTWGDIKDSLRKGTTYFSEQDWKDIKKFLEDSHVSASEINQLMNQLKDAQASYTNGFKVWLEDNTGILQREGLTIDEAYNKYLNALSAAEEVARKQDALANHPSTRYNNAKQIEENRAELEKEVEAWNKLSEGEQNWARITNSVPEVIFQPMRNDPTKTLDYATRSAVNFISKIGDVGKEQENVFSSITNSMFKTVNVFDEYENRMENVRPFSDVMSGGGNMQIVLQDMERLNTSFLTSKAGLEQLSTAFDTVSSKKDKTASLTDGFELVKGKVAELGQSFAPDAMSKMLSGIPEAFKKAWSDALNVMKLMWSEMAKWINSNAKIEIPKTKIGNQEVGGGTVQLRIPKFDVGGSIPNDGSLFFANEKGPEVMANMGRTTGIMNTDQMEAAIANGMAKALANGNQNVTVVLNGDAASFFTAMVKENNSSIMRTGASPLRV